ncbi:MAG: shikimate dehydrogenase family protein, partial [Desulfatiglandales bacterium]
AIEEVMDPRGASCLIIGAGGTATAIARALKERGCQISITNRTREKGLVLAEFVGGRFFSERDLTGHSFDLVVQATPLGMFPNTDSWPLDPCSIKASLAMDVVYNPMKTKFLRGCEARGSKIILGYKMFLHQAALQLRLFLDIDPPIHLMEKIILEALDESD